MFIFNTTFVITRAKFENWENWMRNTYVPLIKNVVPACEVGTYEVMIAESGKEERTVSVQWKVSTPEDLEEINRQSPLVLGQMHSDFGQEVLYFSSILKAL